MPPHLWNRFEDQEEAGANQFFSGRHPNPPAEAFGMRFVLHRRSPAIKQVWAACCKKNKINYAINWYKCKYTTNSTTQDNYDEPKHCIAIQIDLGKSREVCALHIVASPRNSALSLLSRSWVSSASLGPKSPEGGQKLGLPGPPEDPFPNWQSFWGHIISSTIR